MTVLIFIAVLVLLIVVHELGHFFVAKWSGMKVDEFGIGYPPKAWGKKIGETEYTLNWLPFGGFVKIRGEDGEEKDTKGSFSSKPRFLQALVLVAGIGMNLIFAYLLITITLGVGVPRALSPEEVLRAPDATLVVSRVVAGSPADKAGLMAGDAIRSLSTDIDTFSSADSDGFTAFIADAKEGEEINIVVTRGQEEITVSVIPEEKIVLADPTRKAIGVGIGVVGTVPLSIFEAPIEGFILTVEIVKQTAIGLLQFFGSIFSFTADLSQVSGPVGIVGAVGDANAEGFTSLLVLTAIISINLALINILPIPALDGGRLLFVIIESIIRRPLPVQFTVAINMLGFAFLILLMIAITASDVFKLLG